MRIVSRTEWGARSPTTAPVYTTWAKRDTFTVHHTGGGIGQTVRAIQDWCMGPEKKHSDIDYNALVRDDGTIYEGRTGLWLVIASHSLNHNTHSLGVAWIGNQTLPSQAALNSIRWIYDEACRRRAAAGYGPLARVVHKDQVTTTDCPGRVLTEWVHNGMKTPAAPAGGGTDMFCMQDDNGPFPSKGPAVMAMQRMVQLAGGDIGPSGVDGDYGPATAAGLASVIGGNGTVYGDAEYVLLHSKCFRGAPGEPGQPGKDGRTPTKLLVQQEALVVAYE